MIIISGREEIFFNEGLDSGLRRIISIHQGIKIAFRHRSRFRLSSNFRLIGGHILRRIVFKAVFSCLIRHCLDLLDLSNRTLIKIILPGHVFIAGISLLIQIHRRIQPHHGYIGAVHTDKIVVHIIEIIIVLQPGDVVIPNLEIRLIQHRISIVKRRADGKHDGHRNGRQNDNTDYFKTLPGSAFLFLLFLSLFHSSVVSGYDLVALFLCLFFLRHVSSPPCISQTGIIPENVKQS